MKFFLLVSAIVVVILSTTASNILANDLLNLDGQIIKLSVLEENAQSVQLEVLLDLTIKNNSKSDIILLKSDFDQIGLTLFKIDEDKKEIVLYNLGTRGSNFVSPKVFALQKQLNVAKIPPSLINIVKSGESLKLKKTTGYMFYKTRTPSFRNEPWQEVLKSSPLFMTITLEMFPHYVNTKPKSNEYFAFGKQIQKKWKKYGYLWLDDIVSEPIPFDLSSTLMKNVK